MPEKQANVSEKAEQQRKEFEKSVEEHVAKAEPEQWEQELTFVNKTALMIAYERYLETKRPGALFQDPFAERVAGVSGKAASLAFSANAAKFQFPNWPEFHQHWTAVRTTFIDAWLNSELKSSSNKQYVSIGAGVCTRTLRLACLANAKGAWEIDMKAVNGPKQKLLKALNSPAFCETHLVDADFNEASLVEVLRDTQHDTSQPTLWLLEGFLMYVAIAKQIEILQSISQLSPSGSSAMVNFMEPSDPESPYASMMMSTAKLRAAFGQGWDIVIHRYGESTLNYGRYPSNLAPKKEWSFAVCHKR